MGLNRVLLVAVIIALASGAIALATIRRKDFAAQQHRPGQQADRANNQPVAAAHATSR